MKPLFMAMILIVAGVSIFGVVAIVDERILIKYKGDYCVKQALWPQ